MNQKTRTVVAGALGECIHAARDPMGIKPLYCGNGAFPGWWN